MEMSDHSKPTFGILLTVFLRTFLATCIGVLFWLVISRSDFFYGLFEAFGFEGWFFFGLLLCCFIGPGAWYINFAKKQYGIHWSIGVTGILTIIVALIWLYFLIDLSSYG